MPYLIVHGKFIIKGKSPDGDTVSFRPNNQEHWLKLTGKRVPRMNRNGDVNIRFEAIDALETHYRGKGWLPEYHQPLNFANQARDFMLRSIGIDPDQVEWDGRIVLTAPDETEGYIATNGVDPWNRVIAFVFHGEPISHDGDDKFYLYPDHVKQSVNFALANEGLIYPTFYSALYPSLRDLISEACVEAREERKGLWPHDVSISGVTIPDPENLSPIMDEHCIFPKLFRRLATHLSQNGQIKNFHGFLYDEPDLAIRIDNCEMATLRRFVGIDDDEDRVYLIIPPEKLLFVPE